MVVVAEVVVVMFAVAPMQEQALEYCRLREQAEAYVGMAVGTAVTGVADAIDAFKVLDGFEELKELKELVGFAEPKELAGFTEPKELAGFVGFVDNAVVMTVVAKTVL